jgi:hypothetical protein
MNDCRCGRPTDAYVCAACAAKLTQALAETPWLWDELQTTIAGRRGVDYRRGGGGSRSTEKPLPYNAAAAEAARDLRAILTAWVLFCSDNQIRHQSPHSGIPGWDHPYQTSRWLLWRVDGLTLHELGPDAVDEITRAVAHGTRLIDRRPDRWYAGPCDCGEDLYARMQKGTVRCRARECDLEYDVADRRDWLLNASREELADVQTISRAVSWLGGQPITHKRIQKWSERGRIKSRGTKVDDRGNIRKLYQVGDVLNLLAEDAQKFSGAGS